MPEFYDGRLIAQETAATVADFGAGTGDYPGQSCWKSSAVHGLMSYNAACRTRTAGTAGDVIMFNVGDLKLTGNTDAAIMDLWGSCYKVNSYTGNTPPGIWLNLLKNGSSGDYAINRDDYGVNFTHTVVIKFPQRSGSSKTFMSNIANGAFTFILANADGGVVLNPDTDPLHTKHYSQTFEAYGTKAGLVCTSISASTDASDAAMTVTFSNIQELGFEDGPPLTLWNPTSSQTLANEEAIYNDTKAAILTYVSSSSALSGGVSTDELLAGLPQR